jgi:hypothetical protein
MRRMKVISRFSRKYLTSLLNMVWILPLLTGLATGLPLTCGHGFPVASAARFKM